MMRRVLIALTLLVALAATRPADAYWGCGYGMNYYGYGLPAGWYTGVNDRVPPYFALHPPVYYSGEIVRIPYGASPFAHPWGPFVGVPMADNAALPIAVAVEAEEAGEGVYIDNEYFKGNRDALPPPKKDARNRGDRGVMIANPFYKPNSRVAARK